TGAIVICDGNLQTVVRTRTASLAVLKMRVPLVATKGNDWVPTPHTGGRNGVEHSERSAELCGWAVVENEAQRERCLTRSTGSGSYILNCPMAGASSVRSNLWLIHIRMKRSPRTAASANAVLRLS